MHKYWLSCSKFTVQVNVQDGSIIWTAPIVVKFIGQPIDNLFRWAHSISRRDNLYYGSVEFREL